MGEGDAKLFKVVNVDGVAKERGTVSGKRDKQIAESRLCIE